jgi:hypothetical protein
VDIIVKTINDLTLALKGRKNTKGDMQIDTLEKINELLNNIPTKIQATKETRKLLSTKQLHHQEKSMLEQYCQP